VGASVARGCVDERRLLRVVQSLALVRGDLPALRATLADRFNLQNNCRFTD
jgi:hypothetical protein